MSVADLAQELGVSGAELVKKIMGLGMGLMGMMGPQAKVKFADIVSFIFNNHSKEEEE